MRQLPYPLLVAAALFCACALPPVARAQVTVVSPGLDITLPANPQAAIEHAREQVAAGDLDGAIRDLRAYVNFHPGEVGPERLLGDLFFRQGNLKEAEAIYQRIVFHLPFDKETHSRLGAVYATENRIDDAIAEFNSSLPGTDSVPDLVQLHLRKGDLRQYQHEREIDAQSNPGDTDAQLELGQVYEALQEPDKAGVYIRRALIDDPKSEMALNEMGLIYLDERRYDDAVQQFQACLTYDGYNYSCLDNLGATYLESGEYDRARSVLNQAHNLQPERGEALVNLGYLADAQGDWKKAVALYVQAMTVYPYAPEAYIDLGYTYNSHGLYQLAQAALIKGLAIAPLDGRIHFLLGDAYDHQGEEALAKQQFEAAASREDIYLDAQELARQRVATLERTVRPKP